MQVTENSRIHKYVRRYFNGFLAPNAKFVFGLCILLTLLSIWIIATRWNINSDFKALLPEESKAALAMTEAGDRIGSGSALFVVIDSPNPNANRSFAKVYAEALREKKGVALAHYHNDKTFFEKNQLLYLNVSDLKKLHHRLKKKIRSAKKKANPFFISLDKKKKNETENDFIETGDLGRDKRNEAQNQYKTYLESDDGYALTLIVRFVESSTDLNATNRLLDDVRELGERLNPGSFHPEMKIEFGGGLINRQKEYKSIVSDIVKSALFTIVGLFLILGLYFRRVRAIFLILTPLIMGVIWSFAFAFLIYGELTIITVFIFAILLGLGIDYAIHLLASYDKYRTTELEPVDALIETFAGTGTATVYGALTTFVTFLVLTFAQFKGLSQFGVVASVGVICSLVAMFTMLPASILVLQTLKPTKLPTKPHEPDYAKITQILIRTAGITIVFSIIISIFGGLNLQNLQFEENFRKIGKVDWPWIQQPDVKEKALAQAKSYGVFFGRTITAHAKLTRQAMEPKSFKRERIQKTIGARYSNALGKQQSSTPTILLFDDASLTRKVYRKMLFEISAGALDSVKAASSIHAFLPGSDEEQEARLTEITKIRKLLKKEGSAFLNTKQKEKIKTLQDKLVDKKITIYDLPLWAKRLFREAGPKAKKASPGEDFAFEYTIYITEDGDPMVGKDARHFLQQIGDLAKHRGEDIRVGALSSIYISMLDEIKNDGLRMISIALFIVFFLLIAAFRSIPKAIFAYSPLLFGSFWMFGILAYLGIKLDFFNVIILPVIIGIGIDDGVHFYHRYLELKHKHALAQTWREIGSAILMTSLTSIIGFGGLALTNYAGLKSIGYVAIIGILATLIATLLVMPSVLYFAEKLNWKSITNPS